MRGDRARSGQPAGVGACLGCGRCFARIRPAGPAGCLRPPWLGANDRPGVPRCATAGRAGGADRGLPHRRAAGVLMLELWSPTGAFASVEAYLRDHGFFEGGADGIVADLYLGYGLSRTMRRTRTPDPPEPCPLPLAACRVRPIEEPPVAGGPFEIGAWRPTWDPAEYRAAVDAVRAAIGAGEV